MTDSDLVALLHGAVNRTTTLTAELRCWRHVSRSQRAFEAARMAPVAMGAMLRHVGGGHADDEGEVVWRVVQGPGGRYRWDQVAQSGTSVTALLGGQGCDGERAWSIGSDSVHLTRPHGCVLVHRLLDPSWVLTHDLDVVGEGESSGRSVLTVHAIARSSHPRSGGAADMASERDLAVDAERGFLHRDTALVDGDPYDTMELRDVVLDAHVEPAVFDPQIPPGFKIVDHSQDPPHPLPWERRRRWHIRWPISRW